MDRWPGGPPPKSRWSLIADVVLPAVFALLATALVVDVVVARDGAAVQDSVAAEPQIAEPDSTAQRASLFPLPFVFYQPETQWGAGVGLLRTHRLAEDAFTSNDGLIFVITEKSQYSVGASSERYTRGNRWRLEGQLSWSRFPDFFYGVGNDTRKADEEAYTMEHTQALLDVRRLVRRGLYLGGRCGFRHTRSVSREDGGLLATGRFTGDRGGNLLGIGMVAAFDRRDHVMAPRSGQYAVLSVQTHRQGSGGDYTFTRVELDVRNYVAPVDGQVLALQLLATAMTGDPPFYELATLGGANVLRGYFEGRYRSRDRVVTQLEYRLAVWRRLGAAFFAGAGEVGARWRSFRFDDLRTCAGGGLRFQLSARDRVNLRIDFGWGQDQSGTYFALGEAF